MHPPRDKVCDLSFQLGAKVKAVFEEPALLLRCIFSTMRYNGLITCVTNLLYATAAAFVGSNRVFPRVAQKTDFRRVSCSILRTLIANSG